MSIIQQNKKTEPPVDTGLIRCVCPSTEDDGFTIQCERCLVWQHAFCVHITHANIPDHYLCDQCLKRKRPKLSKRITISKKKFRKLDAAEETLSKDSKKKRSVKSRIISRYVHPLFKEARERWSSNNKWKQHFDDESSNHGPLLCDHGPFVTMDANTLFTKGVLMNTPVSNQGLFATRPIPALRYLMEVTGDILLKSEFKFDPVNDFVVLGTPLSHIMFYPSLDLCIDTRQFGNKARYIRRSCHPNAELRNVVLPQSREDKTIHLGLFARHAIEKGQEITISWNWQRGHISWKESMNWHHQHKQKHSQDVNGGHQVIDEEEERRKKITIKNMLDRFEKEFGVCACLNKRRCLIEHLKRQCAPPKELPISKPPSSVNVIPNKGGRRKSSVILLKPKPSLPQPIRLEEQGIKRTAQSVFTNKSISKDTSDDELLDVDGDIDIGDDLPVPLDIAPPLLDDISSDEENADLSSLSSLSSLSVFEDSANENSDEAESKAKLRKKKSTNRHHHKSSKQSIQPPATSSSIAASVPTTRNTDITIPMEKSSAPLPRKKLWMRDYLSKHSNVNDQITKKHAGPDLPAETAIKTDQATSVGSIAQNNVAIVYSKEDTTADIKPVKKGLLVADETKCAETTNEPFKSALKTEQDTKSVADTTAISEVLEKSENQRIEIAKEKQHKKQGQGIEINSVQEMDVVMTDAETIDVTNIEETNVFDIDDGELSDASTILLDDDELEQVYNRDTVADSHAATVDANKIVNAPPLPPPSSSSPSSSSLLNSQQNLHLKDTDIIPNNNNIATTFKSELTQKLDLIEKVCNHLN